MTMQFPVPALLAMAVGLLAMVILAYRSERRAVALQRTVDIAASAGARHCAQGYDDGLKLGLARGLGEGEQSAAKHFQAGYDAALADLDRQDEGEAATGLLATCA